jgi:hypothetical protein
MGEAATFPIVVWDKTNSSQDTLGKKKNPKPI